VSSAPRRIYMDNSATSSPKPPGVLRAINDYATRLGASPGRGMYAEAREAARLMNQCRQRINTLINGSNPSHVIFTLNTSDALNLAIRGVLRPGDHAITTALDHNSVLRSFNHLAMHHGLKTTRVACDPTTGLIEPADIRKAITPATKLIAVNHASNVMGTIQPIGEIGKIAREAGVTYLVDAAQSLGHVPLDVQAEMIDLLAFPGHKGLLGPVGTGGLYIRPGVEKIMTTVREGGTGSRSDLDVQPELLPDRFEPGSHNAMGILGLSEGVQYILEQGVENIWQHELSLCRTMLEALSDAGIPGAGLPGLKLFGPSGIKNRLGVFSIRVEGLQPQALSDVLENRYGILTRSGIHCAPWAHETLGTRASGGTTRLSFGPFNSREEVVYAGDALAQICQEQVAGAR
jgi:cysteine desulfurase/selenocysteine lyase